MTSPLDRQGPLVATTPAELAGMLTPARLNAERIVLVPTMGALHEGHASLMRVARERVGEGPVVVSIFVNPLQFGPGEDLDRYPRTLDDDLLVCAREGVDIVFAPDVAEVYPDGEPQVTVEPGPIGTLLEGKTRPGHFRGVLTVVAKLFGLVRPDVAVFGEKDYQQFALIRRMVADLALGVEVIAAPTQREPDGLALSSRNRFLGQEDRRVAASLSRALFAARTEAERGVEAALAAARAELREADGVDLDYLVIRAVDLTELPEQIVPGTRARALIAARIGNTRLIDNLELQLGSNS